MQNKNKFKNMKTKNNWLNVLMFVVASVGAYLGFEEPNLMFATLPALALVVWGATQAIKQIPKFPKLAIQITSWLLGLGFAYSGWALKLGFLVEETWQSVFLYGLGASMIANSLADAETVQTLINIIKSLFTKKVFNFFKKKTAN